jgi:hypothetical protein
LHCGVRGVSFAGFSFRSSVLSDRNALRNPQRQLTSDQIDLLIESFLADLKASKGVIITNKGYSEAAYNRAIYDTQDIELRIIDFKDLDKFQNFGAVVWSGKYCSYIPAPPGWVMDAKVFGGAVAAIVPAGLNSKTAFKSEGFIYVSYSHKDKNFPDLKTLIDTQQKRLKETYPKSKIDYKELKIREERVVLRCAEISESYEGPEYTTFIDFKEYVLFLVLLVPWNKEENYLMKLIWTTEKLIAGTCISNIEGKPISVHNLKNKLK